MATGVAVAEGIPNVPVTGTALVIVGSVWRVGGAAVAGCALGADVGFAVGVAAGTTGVGWVAGAVGGRTMTAKLHTMLATKTMLRIQIAVCRFCAAADGRFIEIPPCDVAMRDPANRLLATIV
jgi:hypothetical protein